VHKRNKSTNQSKNGYSDLKVETGSVKIQVVKLKQCGNVNKEWETDEWQESGKALRIEVVYGGSVIIHPKPYGRHPGPPLAVTMAVPAKG
jgi:hypothetical protein